MTRNLQMRAFAERLQRRRRDLLEVSAGTRRELQALHNQEHDPEYEENAQADLADYTLWNLLETHRRELRLIDNALARLEQGVFGRCIDCGSDISFDRLEALPYALRCEEDATLHEMQTAPATAHTSL